jgi:hypothetical protein
MLVFVVMLMIVVVIVLFVRMVEGGRRFGRLRFGLVFDVGRTQRFAFQAHYAPNKCHSGLETALFCCRPQLGAAAQGTTSPLWLGEISILMVRGIAGRVKPPSPVSALERTAEGTLLFGDLRLANVLEEAGMSGAELSVVGAGLFQAELAVHREAHFSRIAVFLAVVLPPAHRAQSQGVWGIQRPVAAAGAAKTNFSQSLHGLPSREWTSAEAWRITRGTRFCGGKTAFCRQRSAVSSCFFLDDCSSEGMGWAAKELMISYMQV